MPFQKFFEGGIGRNRGDWSSAPNSGLVADWVTPNHQYNVTTDPNPPISGTFSFNNMTSDQFISMMQQSGFAVSGLDTLLGIHSGLNMRDSSSVCSVHLHIDPFSGQYGNPITGDFHIDLFNPLTPNPLPFPGSLPNIVFHATSDVGPDILQAQGLPVTTGNQLCPHQ